MPYKDPDKAREAKRRWAQQYRAKNRRTSRTVTISLPPAQNPGGQVIPLQGSVVPAPLPGVDLRDPEALLDLLAEAVAMVRQAGPTADPVGAARCLGYLARMAAEIKEAMDLQQRVDALELALKQRRGDAKHG